MADYPESCLGDSPEPDSDLWYWVTTKGGYAKDEIWPPDSVAEADFVGRSLHGVAQKMRDATKVGADVWDKLSGTWPDSVGLQLRHLIKTGNGRISIMADDVDGLAAAFRGYAELTAAVRGQIGTTVSDNEFKFSLIRFTNPWEHDFLRTQFAKHLARNIAGQVSKAAEAISNPQSVHSDKPPIRHPGALGAVVDFVEDLGGLIGYRDGDWNVFNAVDTWEGLGKLGLALESYATASPTALLDLTTGQPGLARHELLNTLITAGKGFVHSDEWGTDWPHALVGTALNVGTLVGSDGIGAALRAAGAGAKATELAGLSQLGSGAVRLGEGLAKVPKVSNLALRGLSKFGEGVEKAENALRDVGKVDDGGPNPPTARESGEAVRWTLHKPSTDAVTGIVGKHVVGELFNEKLPHFHENSTPDPRATGAPAWSDKLGPYLRQSDLTNGTLGHPAKLGDGTVPKELPGDGGSTVPAHGGDPTPPPTHGGGAAHSGGDAGPSKPDGGGRASTSTLEHHGAGTPGTAAKPAGEAARSVEQAPAVARATAEKPEVESSLAPLGKAAEDAAEPLSVRIIEKSVEDSRESRLPHAEPPEPPRLGWIGSIVSPAAPLDMPQVPHEITPARPLEVREPKQLEYRLDGWPKPVAPKLLPGLPTAPANPAAPGDFPAPEPGKPDLPYHRPPQPAEPAPIEMPMRPEHDPALPATLPARIDQPHPLPPEIPAHPGKGHDIPDPGRDPLSEIPPEVLEQLTDAEREAVRKLATDAGAAEVLHLVLDEIIDRILAAPRPGEPRRMISRGAGLADKLKFLAEEDERDWLGERLAERTGTKPEKPRRVRPRGRPIGPVVRLRNPISVDFADAAERERQEILAMDRFAAYLADPGNFPLTAEERAEIREILAYRAQRAGGDNPSRAATYRWALDSPDPIPAPAMAKRLHEEVETRAKAFLEKHLPERPADPPPGLPPQVWERLDETARQALIGLDGLDVNGRGVLTSIVRELTKGKSGFSRKGGLDNFALVADEQLPYISEKLDTMFRQKANKPKPATRGESEAVFDALGFSRHLAKIERRLRKQGVKTGDIASQLRHFVDLVRENPEAPEVLVGARNNLSGLEGELYTAWMLSVAGDRQLAELGLAGLEIVEVREGFENGDGRSGDIDVRGRLPDGRTVRIEIKNTDHIGVGKEAKWLEQATKEIESAPPGTVSLFVISNRLTPETTSGLAASAKTIVAAGFDAVVHHSTSFAARQGRPRFTVIATKGREALGGDPRLDLDTGWWLTGTAPGSSARSRSTRRHKPPLRQGPHPSPRRNARSAEDGFQRAKAAVLADPAARNHLLAVDLDLAELYARFGDDLPKAVRIAGVRGVGYLTDLYERWTGRPWSEPVVLADAGPAVRADLDSLDLALRRIVARSPEPRVARDAMPWFGFNPRDTSEVARFRRLLTRGGLADPTPAELLALRETAFDLSDTHDLAGRRNLFQTRPRLVGDAVRHKMGRSATPAAVTAGPPREFHRATALSPEAAHRKLSDARRRYEDARQDLADRFDHVKWLVRQLARMVAPDAGTDQQALDPAVIETVAESYGLTTSLVIAILFDPDRPLHAPAAYQHTQNAPELAHAAATHYRALTERFKKAHRELQEAERIWAGLPQERRANFPAGTGTVPDPGPLPAVKPLHTKRPPAVFGIMGAIASAVHEAEPARLAAETRYRKAWRELRDATTIALGTALRDQQLEDRLSAAFLEFRESQALRVAAHLDYVRGLSGVIHDAAARKISNARIAKATRLPVTEVAAITLAPEMPPEHQHWLRERFLNVREALANRRHGQPLPKEVRAWFRDQDPTDPELAAKLTDAGLDPWVARMLGKNLDAKRDHHNSHEHWSGYDLGDVPTEARLNWVLGQGLSTITVMSPIPQRGMGLISSSSGSFYYGALNASRLATVFGHQVMHMRGQLSDAMNFALREKLSTRQRDRYFPGISGHRVDIPGPGAYLMAQAVLHGDAGRWLAETTFAKELVKPMLKRHAGELVNPLWREYVGKLVTAVELIRHDLAERPGTAGRLHNQITDAGLTGLLPLDGSGSRLGSMEFLDAAIENADEIDRLLAIAGHGQLPRTVPEPYNPNAVELLEAISATGQILILHNDMGEARLTATGQPAVGPPDERNLWAMAALLQREKFAKANVVWAHLGVGHWTNLTEDHLGWLRWLLKTVPGLKMDISWNVLPQHLQEAHDDRLKEQFKQFFVDHRYRLLYGSDAVNPQPGGHFYRHLYEMHPLFAEIERTMPAGKEAVRDVLTGNFLRLHQEAGERVERFAFNEIHSGAWDGFLRHLGEEKYEKVRRWYDTKAKDGWQPTGDPIMGPAFGMAPHQSWQDNPQLKAMLRWQRDADLRLGKANLLRRWTGAAGLPFADLGSDARIVAAEALRRRREDGRLRPSTATGGALAKPTTLATLIAERDLRIALRQSDLDPDTQERERRRMAAAVEDLERGQLANRAKINELRRTWVRRTRAYAAALTLGAVGASTAVGLLGVSQDVLTAITLGPAAAAFLVRGSLNALKVTSSQNSRVAWEAMVERSRFGAGLAGSLTRVIVKNMGREVDPEGHNPTARHQLASYVREQADKFLLTMEALQDVPLGPDEPVEQRAAMVNMMSSRFLNLVGRALGGAAESLSSLAPHAGPLGKTIATGIGLSWIVNFAGHVGQAFHGSSLGALTGGTYALADALFMVAALPNAVGGWSGYDNSLRALYRRVQNALAFPVLTAANGLLTVQYAGHLQGWQALIAALLTYSTAKISALGLRIEAQRGRVSPWVGPAHAGTTAAALAALGAIGLFPGLTTELLGVGATLTIPAVRGINKLKKTIDARRDPFVYAKDGPVWTLDLDPVTGELSAERTRGPRVFSGPRGVSVELTLGRLPRVTPVVPPKRWAPDPPGHVQAVIGGLVKPGRTPAERDDS